MPSRLTSLSLATSLALMCSIGCFKKVSPIPVKRPEKLLLQADAAAALNPGPDGEPMSVVVYVYQLKDRNDFQKLTFDLASSNRPDQELFPQDLISRMEVILIPGSRLSETLDLQSETRYIGLIGLFRKPDAFAWRKLVATDALLPRLEPAKAGPTTTGKLPPQTRLPLLAFRAEQCYLELTEVQSEPLAGQPDGTKPECVAAPVKPHEPQPLAEVTKSDTTKPDATKSRPTRNGAARAVGSSRPR